MTQYVKLFHTEVCGFTPTAFPLSSGAAPASCYKLNGHALPKFICQSLTPSVAVLGGGAFGR